MKANLGWNLFRVQLHAILSKRPCICDSIARAEIARLLQQHPQVGVVRQTVGKGEFACEKYTFYRGDHSTHLYVL